MNIVHGSYTDKGMRNDNQDRVMQLILDNISAFAVADGIGGLSHGEEAAAAAVKAIQTELEECMYIDPRYIQELLRLKFIQVNDYLYNKSLESCLSMGTTLSVLVFLEDRFVLSNVGDTKVYLLRDNSVNVISMVHALPTKRNVLTMAIGPSLGIEPYTLIGNLEEGDIYLICSDGIANYIDDGTFIELTKTNDEVSETEMNDICKRFGETALLKGSEDNISIIAVKIFKEMRD